MSTEPSIRDLQRQLEEQQRVIGRLQEQVQRLQPGDHRSISGLVDRRSVLAALGFALLPAALAERATADDAADYACVWLGNQDANGFQLDDLKEINFSDGTTLSSASGVGGGSGALSDSGSDNPDGGDQYVLPQAEDSIDLQSAGDIENAASIATDQATLTGARDETRSIAGFDSDGASGDALSLSLSSLGGVDEAEVVVVVEGNGGGAFADVNITANGDANGYSQTDLNGTTLSTSVSNSQWDYGQFDTNTAIHRFRITRAGSSLSIKQLTGASNGADKLFSGSVGGSHSGGLTAVSVSTGFNAAGRAYVIGVSDS